MLCVRKIIARTFAKTASSTQFSILPEQFEDLQTTIFGPRLASLATLDALFLFEFLAGKNFAQYDLYFTRTLLKKKKKKIRNPVCQPTFVTLTKFQKK